MMRPSPSRGLAVALAAVLVTPLVPAQESEPADATLDPGRPQLEELKAGFQQARRDWWTAYEEAETDEARHALVDEQPEPEGWFDRFLALADEHPGTEVAGEALAWIAGHAEDGRPEVLDRLAEKHVDGPAMAGVCRSFWYAESEVARSFLERVLEASTLSKVQGNACYSLGKVWKNRAGIAVRMDSDPTYRKNYGKHYGDGLLDLIAATGEDDCRKKAEELMERVAEEYADLSYVRDRTLGDKAEADLYEMRNLRIGMTAPEIEGESIHGEPMKLSDFRGKVVVLDFWGHW